MKVEDKRFDGRIVNYNHDRGFGFIESLSIASPVWFHFKHIRGAQNSVLYHELNTSKEFSGLTVSFTIVKEGRGWQARDIIRVSPFFELEQFLRNTPSSRNLEEFIQVASIAGVLHISKDADLSLITVNRVIKSGDSWSRMIELAKLWRSTINLLSITPSSTRRLNETEKVTCLAFLSALLECLGFKPASNFSFLALLPLLEQSVHNPNIPLKCFRQASRIVINIIPNVQVVEKILASQPKLLAVSRDEMRINVILEGVVSKEYLARIGYSNNEFVLLDEKAILRLLMSDNEDLPSRFGAVLWNQLPIHRLQPYEVGSAYSASIYAGRARERIRILDDVESNHAIFGGRKIGKTWFLKDLCRWGENDEKYREIYFPIYISLQAVRGVEDAVDMIAEVIHSYLKMSESVAKNPQAKLRNTLRKAHDVTGKVVLLALDEIDDLLRHEDAYEFFGTLRGIQSTYPNSIKYVFAGFKALMGAFSRFEDNHPFGNWIGKGNGFALGCLDEQDTKSLIVNPLRWMGYEFNEREVISAIIGLTSGHPYYTQCLCLNILKARSETNSGPVALNASTIEGYASKEFFDDVFDIFLANLSSLQLLIGKVFQGSAEPFSELDIITRLRDEFEITLREDQVRREMEILQACSVFVRTEDGYRPMMERINELFFATRDSVELALRHMGEQETK